MEMLLVGINLLVLIAVWKLMFRKSVLDHHRDQLFDLRDELRREYLSNGVGLASPMYKRLRDLINGYLRFTEGYSLPAFSYMTSRLRHNPSIETEIRAKIEADFASRSDRESKYIKSLRFRALSIMMSYMVMSSGPMMLIALALTPLVVLSTCFDVLRRGGRVALALCWRKSVDLRETSWALGRLIVAAAARCLPADFVEEYSYRQGRDTAWGAPVQLKG